jgi:YesN/AraC family two-component response regulator
MPLAQEEPSDPSPIARTLIGQLLEYLNKHYAESDLSLSQVADAVDKNPKYVTHLFAQQVGERMRTYITTLRVRRACELLLQTNRTIEQIASDSGFTRTVQFRQSFRRTIGVTASEYRQIFTAGV